MEPTQQTPAPPGRPEQPDPPQVPQEAGQHFPEMASTTPKAQYVPVGTSMPGPLCTLLGVLVGTVVGLLLGMDVWAVTNSYVVYSG